MKIKTRLHESRHCLKVWLVLVVFYTLPVLVSFPFRFEQWLDNFAVLCQYLSIASFIYFLFRYVTLNTHWLCEKYEYREKTIVLLLYAILISLCAYPKYPAGYVATSIYGYYIALDIACLFVLATICLSLILYLVIWLYAVIKK